MQRIQLERVLEGVNRLRKLLELRINRAQEVPGVGIAVVEFDHTAKIIHRRLRIAAVFLQHPQAVPGVRVFRIVLRRGFEDFLGRIHATQAQQRDALIQSRHLQTGIESSGVFEVLETLFE